jgi:hypothetical protein
MIGCSTGESGPPVGCSPSRGGREPKRPPSPRRRPPSGGASDSRWSADGGCHGACGVDPPGDGAGRSGSTAGRSQPGGCQLSGAPGPPGPPGASGVSPPPPRWAGSCQSDGPSVRPSSSKASPSRSRGVLIAGVLLIVLVVVPLAGSAVGVPRSAAADGTRALLPAGGRRTHNAQLRHDVPADPGTQLAQDARREQPQLGGPCRGLRDDEQLTLVQRLRAAVRSDVRPDEGVPATEDRADLGARGPVLLGDQRVDQGPEQLRIVGSGPRTGPAAARAGDPTAGGLRAGGRRRARGLECRPGDVRGSCRALVSHRPPPPRRRTARRTAGRAGPSASQPRPAPGYPATPPARPRQRRR